MKFILSQYVATINCLRIVDPPEVLLSKVADLTIFEVSPFSCRLSLLSFLPLFRCSFLLRTSLFLLLPLSHLSPAPTQLTPPHRNRPDTIRCIVANLAGDDSDGGDAFVDENEPIVPLQQMMDSLDDYGDPNWEPNSVDVGPGGWSKSFSPLFFCSGVSYHSTRPKLCLFTVTPPWTCHFA